RADLGRRGRYREVPRRDGRHRSCEGGRRHHPEGSCEIHRRELRTWFGCARDSRGRNRAVLLRQRNRRLIAADWAGPSRGGLAVIWLLQAFDPAHLSAVLTQLHADIQKPAFWIAVGKIIWINVLLSGDNALVIAMACRGLRGRHRLWGMAIGAGIAVILLILFTAVVATLMQLPYVKVVGGVALLVIATKLLVPEDEGDEIAAGTTLWHAVRIVVIADIIMSLDNVIAVAAAANGQVPLLILGLAISIPMIVAGAALIMLVLDRFPILVWLGAILLGWIAGDVMETDPVVQPVLHR